jgi:Protein of unknown function (DUF1997)
MVTTRVTTAACAAHMQYTALLHASITLAFSTALRCWPGQGMKYGPVGQPELTLICDGSGRRCGMQEIPGKGLEQYLSLPVEDYNSLDPEVVQFLGNNTFRLTPPLAEWFHLNLHPEIILRIQPEPEHSRVR